MKTINLMRTNGSNAQVSIKYNAGDSFSNPSVFSLITPEIKISNAKLMTESDIDLYANALKECTAVVGGSVEGENGIISCIRLDELSAAKLYREMQLAHEAVGETAEAAVR